VTSVWDINYAKSLLGVFLDALPTSDLNDLPTRWVNSDTAPTSMISVALGTDVASGPLRHDVATVLRSTVHRRWTDPVIAGYVTAIDDPSNDHHTERPNRHQNLLEISPILANRGQDLGDVSAFDTQTSSRRSSQRTNSRTQPYQAPQCDG
jgi:hypothetical protein